MAELVNMPKLGLGMTFGIITKVLAEEGQKVKKDETLVEFETNKMTDSLAAPIDGIVLKMCVKEGEEVPIRKTVFVVGEPGDEYILEAGVGESPAPAAVPQVSAEEPTQSGEQKGAPINVSTIAKKLADEKGVDLTKVKGTGPKGRIMKEDVLAYAENPNDNRTIEDSVVSMSSTRKSIAEAVVKSKHDIPHVYLEACADVTELVTARKRYMESGRGKVSYNDVILYAAVLALKEHMELNASVDGDKICRHGTINVGVPTNNERGLLVPVIKDAGNMKLWDIHLKCNELVEKTKKSKLSMDEASGGTFTVSNLGGFGIRSFHAIINVPEAMILAVGEIYSQLQLAENGIVTAEKINLSLSMDHRLADGLSGALYLKSLKTILENPEALFQD